MKTMLALSMIATSFAGRLSFAAVAPVYDSLQAYQAIVDAPNSEEIADKLGAGETILSIQWMGQIGGKGSGEIATYRVTSIMKKHVDVTIKYKPRAPHPGGREIDSITVSEVTEE